MSGDVQPRKRKDKRKKKDESDEGIGPTKSTHSPSHGSLASDGDSVIHVHHEGGTGGHWCAKIVFFMLLGVLVFLIGLIIIENRGLTDLDTPVGESRYAQVFDGWVDEGPVHDDHHDEHTLELNHAVDSMEEEVVENSAGEEEHLAAKQAEQLAHEQEESGRGKPSGGNAVDDLEPEEWVDDSNDHWKLQLDLAQAEMDEGHIEESVQLFTALSLTNKSCSLAKLGLARAMDLLAEKKRSNSLLQAAIDEYLKVLNMNVDNNVYKSVAERTINRIRFKGQPLSAVPVHEKLISKFPAEPEYRNQLAITYLMVNK